MSAARASGASKPVPSWLRRIFFEFLYVLASAIARPFFHFRAVGASRIPAGRRLVLAPNHASFLDPLAVQLAVPRHLTFLMTEEIYRIAWARWFFRLMGVIPVPEERVPVSAIREGVAAIERGELLVVFPEGRISRTGELGRGYPGVLSIAARARAAIVPVHIAGTFKALPRSARFIRPARITVRIGDPIEIEGEERLDRQALRDLTDRVMASIRALGEH
jgi:1-acyl-sn-glycerol-3-phosphate acyltransferase